MSGHANAILASHLLITRPHFGEAEIIALRQPHRQAGYVVQRVSTLRLRGRKRGHGFDFRITLRSIRSWYSSTESGPS